MKRKRRRTEYRTVDVTTIAGIKTAERLKANGWVIYSSSPWRIQFYRRKVIA